MSVMRHRTFRLAPRDMHFGRPRVVWPQGPRPWGLWDWLSLGLAMRAPSPYERMLGRVEAFVNEVGADHVVAINETNAGFGAMVTVWYREGTEAPRKPEKAYMAEL